MSASSAAPELADITTGPLAAVLRRPVLDGLVGECLGTPARVDDLAVTPVDHPDASIATDALQIWSGTAATATGTRPWSMFVKSLHSAALWPLLSIVPVDDRQRWAERFPWRLEIDAYRSRLPEILPAGMRLPHLYGVVEIDDQRATMFLEAVAASKGRWTPDQYVRASRALGTLAGRRPIGTDLVFGPAPENAEIGFALRMFVAGRVRLGAAGMLADDALWSHPAMRDAVAATHEESIRSELLTALNRLDQWLAAMDELPQTYVHGDASPQNLLVPVDDPAAFVVIDFGLNSPQCVGFDLGQLLVGHVHAGLLPAAELAAIHSLVIPAYAEGLRSTGFAATAEQVQYGCRLALLVQSLFTALPLERLYGADEPGLRDELVGRLELARYLLTLAG